jgi:hypothetical protein
VLDVRLRPAKLLNLSVSNWPFTVVGGQEQFGSRHGSAQRNHTNTALKPSCKGRHGTPTAVAPASRNGELAGVADFFPEIFAEGSGNSPLPLRLRKHSRYLIRELSSGFRIRIRTLDAGEPHQFGGGPCR